MFHHTTTFHFEVVDGGKYTSPDLLNYVVTKISEMNEGAVVTGTEGVPTICRNRSHNNVCRITVYFPKHVVRSTNKRKLWSELTESDKEFYDSEPEEEEEEED